MPILVGFNDVHFFGNEGWITGGNDQMFYTPDGGETLLPRIYPRTPG